MSISRRKFLQILGSSSAAGLAGGLAGCADSAEQKIFPYVKGEAEQIPGVSVWYHSTCGECDAGCGIQVRTREGRAVKVEGNAAHPINRGGVCALGQASLQGLYDPDRVRQPLKRKMLGGGRIEWEPISWDEAYDAIGAALKDSAKDKFLLTGEVSGTLDELIKQLGSDGTVGLKHVAFDPLQPTALAKASELVYGTYGIPHYSIDQAEVLVSFGADFLETWVSPCEFARDWAKTRKSARPVKVIQVEPRASLTAANADLWLCSKPGSEVYVALAVLRQLLIAGRGKNLSDDVRSELENLSREYSPEIAAEQSGIAREKILVLIDHLNEAKHSLVIAGGAAGATQDQLPLQVVAHFINAVLENVGSTVDLSAMRKPKTSLAKLVDLVERMKSGKVGVLLIHGTNPEFTLPAEHGFGYAVATVPLVVSLSSQLDETSRLAHYIIPSHTSLESWGDHRPYGGVYSLMQPTMTPVFDTRSLGDQLIQMAERAGKPITRKGESEASKDFYSYLRASWRDVHAALGVGEDFNSFWLACVERGGYFSNGSAASGNRERPKVKVNRDVFRVAVPPPEVKGHHLVLLAYPSVRSFDGRAANRPWLQELPDQMTQAVWDAWAEVHPDTAHELGVSAGDLVTLRNDLGEVNVPVFLTPYIHREVVAMPLGQGHTAYGRYAELVAPGNSVMQLISAANSASGGNVPLQAGQIKLVRALGRGGLVVLQGSDSQEGRELARTTFVSGGAALAAHAEQAHGEHAEHEAHHELKQMYAQREHPIYEWGMVVDLAACTGCSACVVACSAENNIPVVGKKACSKGREMSWLRIERYHDGGAEELQVSFLPMMCQQCHNAPCEPVCPVFATYHTEEGLNSMAYNRCVGTRYCSNNCSYKVRRFNWYDYDPPEPLSWQMNPDVVKRTGGVMEKCTFCIQRIVDAKDRAKDLGRLVEDGEVKPACVQSCPTQALSFGNLKDSHSRVSSLSHDARAYKVLDHHINTQPAISYLERVRVKI